MTMQTTNPMQRLGLGTTNEPLSQLVRQWQTGALDPNPPYQRQPVWTPEQQTMFIGSMISGLPLPAIITNRRTRNYGNDKPIRIVIDGQQRLTAARAFFEDRLPVPASWFDPDDIVGDSVTVDYDTGDYVYFSALADGEQGRIEWQAAIPVAEGDLATEQDEAAVYLRINGLGTPQTDEDMERARTVANDPGQRA